VGVLSPVGGALADRLDRRRWLAAGNVAQGGLAVVLAFASAAGHASPLVVTGISFLNGCVAALTLPFQMAMTPDLVPRDELLAATSLGSAQYNLGRVIGPALAGAVIATTSYTMAFVVNAASFLAVVAALIVMHLPTVPKPAHREGIWHGIKEGVRVARREPGCRAAIGLIAAVAFLAAPFIALIPAKANLLATDAKQTAGITGILTTAQGVGAVIGALLVAPLAARLGRRRALQVAIFSTCAALTIYGYAPNVASAALALAFVGASYIGVLSGLNTVVQLRAPAAYRARVLSLFFVALGVVYPIGALVQGALADHLTLARTTTAGAVALSLVVAALAFLRPATLDALDGDQAAPITTEEAVAPSPAG
jgi:MFS family permease